MLDDAVTFHSPKDRIRQDALTGVGWVGFSRIVNQILQFLFSILLARLLMPEDFGLVGMILVFTGFAALFSELGFNAALIQAEKIEERHYSSVYWVNLMIGVLLTLIFFNLAPSISGFYQEERLTPLVRVLSLHFSLGALASVPQVIMTRKIQFRKLALVEITATLIGGMIATLLAFSGYRFWSLVWQMLTSAMVSCVLLWWICAWKPKPQIDIFALKELLKFSGYLLGFNVINYWIRNGDNMLIGKFIGVGALGIYSRAYNLMTIPLSYVSHTLGRVMFPLLSKIQKDKARVKSIFIRSISAIAFITFPMMLGLCVVAKPFVLTLLGEKWSGVILLIQILALVGFVQSIESPLGWIYQSQGRTDLFFWWGVGSGVILIGSILIGIWIGNVAAVAACYAFSSVILLPYPSFAIAGKLIGMRFSEVIRHLAPIAGCSSLMAILVWFLGSILSKFLSNGGLLVTEILAGILSYLFFIHIFRLKAYLDFKKLICDQWDLKSLGKNRTS